MRSEIPWQTDNYMRGPEINALTMKIWSAWNRIENHVHGPLELSLLIGKARFSEEQETMTLSTCKASICSVADIVFEKREILRVCHDPSTN